MMGSKLSKIVNQIDSLEYNAFITDKTTNYNPLYFTLKFFYQKYDWRIDFGIPDSKMSNFAYGLQKLYHIHNSYHNAIHAADVVQFVYWMLSPCRGRDVFNLNKENFFAIMIAAAGHDVDHPGHNNWFELKSKSVLATVYNDQSILENHHAATTFKLAQTEEAAIFDGLGEESQKNVRSWIIDMILATDNSKHFEKLNKVKAKLDAGEADLMKDDQRIALENLVHAADIGNPA